MGQTAHQARGDGFLAQRLERVFEMPLQRRIGLRDWTAVSLIVIGVQVVGVTRIDALPFVLLLVLAAVVLAVLWFLMPRSQPKQALAIVAWTNVAALLAISLLVHSTGGPQSPYIFFFALSMVSIAAFSEPAWVRRALITFTVICTTGPLIHDISRASSDKYTATIAIAIPVWLLMALMISWKRLSAVRAELNARRLAFVDTLTGTANRRAIEEFAEDLNLLGVPWALATVRIEGLDEINRSAGHFFGDAALRRAAEAMREASFEQDQVARLNGALFAVLLPGGDIDAARRWCSRMQERLEISNAGAEAGTNVSASAGCAATGEGGSMLSELISRADAAASRIVEAGDAHSVATAISTTRTELFGAHIRSQADERQNQAIPSVDAPTSIWLSIVLSALLGVAIGLTGGASSVLLSVPLLLVAYFATFGSGREALVATVAAVIAATAAVIANAPVGSVDEIRTLTVLAVSASLADTLTRNGRMLASAERRAAELTLVDPLTALSNRAAFVRDLEGVIHGDSARRTARVMRLEGPPAVLVIEIDGFLDLQQRLGHAGGDLLLLEVADALRDVLAEIGPVYRVGGFSFATVFGSYHRHHVDAVAERCVDAVAVLGEEPRYSARGNIVGAHTGGATWSEGTGAEELFNAALEECTGRGRQPAGEAIYG